MSDDNKQIALVTALHGGPERSGSTSALRIVEWLLGDSPLARETRRKQIVLVMPIPNPYAFFATDRFNDKEGIDLYDTVAKWWNLKTLTLAAPEKAPELAAFLSVVDEYMPEVHIDLHGTGMQRFLPTEIPADRKMPKGLTMFTTTTQRHKGQMDKTPLPYFRWIASRRSPIECHEIPYFFFSLRDPSCWCVSC